MQCSLGIRKHVINAIKQLHTIELTVLQSSTNSNVSDCKSTHEFLHLLTQTKQGSEFTGQFANEPTRNQPSHRLVNSWAS